ncbi:MAG TPA: YciI family protein [Jiangellaceae bacterium]
MSVWIVELKLEPTDERLAARPAHREKLAQLHDDGVVRMAGPFSDDSGAVVIVDADDRAVVDRLLADDPYYAIDGVTVTSVREWRPFII